MMYFIPAWYKNGEWKEKEEVWYTQKKEVGFDDTVKQIQLFSRSELYPYKILLLQHSPNLRHFLHRQSIYRAEYWSCFDSIQCVSKQKVELFSYRDLNWPQGISFLSTPFALCALLDGKMYAQVEFGDYGNMILVDFYREDLICRRNLYDDRGFISSTIVYREGKPFYEQYLDETGVWKITHFFEDQHVEVNPKSDYYLGQKGIVHYKKTRYRNMEEVLLEVFSDFLRGTKSEDLFCVAMHPLHLEIIKKSLKQKKYVLSFYRKRMFYERKEDLQEFFAHARYLVTDTRHGKRNLERGMGRVYRNCVTISPFDFRMDHSISLEMHTKNICVAVDGLPDAECRKLVLEFCKYIKSEDRIQIAFFTRKEGNRAAELLQKTKQILSETGNLPMFCHFSVDVCGSEMSINRCVREKAILVDLREMPDHFLEMSALSMGIPQLVKKETQYVKNKKNGQEISQLSELCIWLDYYLQDLTHLNEAKIESYRIGKKFSSEKIKKQWEYLIAEAERM